MLVNIRLIASATLIALLAGCAANPYTKVPLPAAGQALTAEEALRYSNNAMEDFRAKRSAEFDRQQGVSGSLFLLGAGALGLTAYKAHKDIIGATALIGATTYQMANWNTNAARTTLYGEGINALACAQAVMAPVLFERAPDDPVPAGIRDVKKAWEAAALASGEIYNFSMSNGDLKPEVRAALQAERLAANKQFNRADRAIAHAERYLALRQRAPADLKVHVDFVRESVDQAVNPTLADIQKLPEAIARLADYSSFFAGLQPPESSESSAAAPAGKSTPTTTTESNDPGTGAAQGQPSQIAALIAKTNALRAAVTALDNSYARISSSATKANMAKCKIDTADTALQLVPETLDLVAGVASESTIDILGSTGLPRVSPVTTTENSPTVVQPRGNAFPVRVSEKTPPGTYLMQVEDQTRRSVMLTVRIAAKPSAPSVTSPDANNPPPKCESGGRSQTEICLLQQVLGVEMDGNFGKETCKAFRSNALTAARFGLFSEPALATVKAHAGLNKDASEASIKAKLRQTCPAAAAPAAAPAPVTSPSISQPTAPKQPCAARLWQSDFECAMSAEEVRQLREKFKLPPEPLAFDDSLRGKLVLFQKEKNLMPRNGVYNQQTKSLLFPN